MRSKILIHLTWIVLVAGVLSLSISVRPALAQDTDGKPVFVSSNNQPLNTLPPPLLLVILLDDSGTMTDRDNSAVGHGPVGRKNTDPANTRREAVRYLLDTLAADQIQQHDVAILSFATTKQPPVWLTGSGPGNRFVSLGKDVKPEVYENVKDSLAKPPSFDGGPGDTALAMSTATTELNNRLASGSFRPVILLITDDVPISNFGISPWSGTSEGWQNTYIDPFEKDLLKLTGGGNYEGYCGRGGTNPKGVTFSVIAMGAANWVNTDGKFGLNDQSEDYFTHLVAATGSFSLYDPTRPLLFPVDPGFTENDADLQADMLNAVDSLLRDLRCADRLAPGSESTTSSTRFTIPVSPAYAQVQLILDLPKAAALKLTAADGGEVSDYPVLERVYGGDDNRDDGKPDYGVAQSGHQRTIITLARDRYSQQWAGNWTLDVETTGALLVANASINLGEIRISSPTIPPTTVLSESLPYQLKFTVDGVPLIDRSLIETISGTLTNISRPDSESSVINFHEPDVDGVYTGYIEQDQLAHEGEYKIGLDVQLPENAFPPTIPRHYNFDFVSLRISSDLVLDVDGGNGLLWTCGDTDEGKDGGFHKVTVVVNMVGNQADIEALYSYTGIVMYYATPTPPGAVALTPVGTAEPFKVMEWQLNNNTFTGNIDCSRLAAGQNQTIDIHARAPVANHEVVATLSFSFNPTPTPMPTLVPSALPVVAATSAPVRPDLSGQIGAVAASPLTLLVILSLGGLGAGALLLRGVPAGVHFLFPMNSARLRVEYRRGDLTRSERLGRGLTRFAAGRTITSRDLERVFGERQQPDSGSAELPENEVENRGDAGQPKQPERRRAERPADAVIHKYVEVRPTRTTRDLRLTLFQDAMVNRNTIPRGRTITLVSRNVDIVFKDGTVITLRNYRARKDA